MCASASGITSLARPCLAPTATGPRSGSPARSASDRGWRPVPGMRRTTLFCVASGTVAGKSLSKSRSCRSGLAWRLAAGSRRGLGIGARRESSCGYGVDAIGSNSGIRPCSRPLPSSAPHGAFRARTATGFGVEIGFVDGDGFCCGTTSGVAIDCELSSGDGLKRIRRPGCRTVAGDFGRRNREPRTGKTGTLTERPSARRSVRGRSRESRCGTHEARTTSDWPGQFVGARPGAGVEMRASERTCWCVLSWH
jgi:hypothetical protein